MIVLKSRVAISREFQVVSKYDVIVVGGGMAGVAAAVSASRNGCRTLLIERYGFLGGMATAGLVTPMMWMSKGDARISGMLDEVLKTAESFGGGDGPYFAPEAMKYALDYLACQSGVDLLLHTYLFDVIQDGTTIDGVAVINKAGKFAYLGDVFIDATGDADLSVLSGIPCEKGNSEGQNQPMTLRFIVGNVNMERLDGFVKNENGAQIINERLQAHNRSTDYPVLEGNLQYFHLPGRKGQLVFNNPRVPGDGTRIKDLTTGEVKGRRTVYETWNFIKTSIPGFEESYLAQTAVQLGVRETRRIIGQYVLTGEDVLSCRKFDDSIAVNFGPVDIHNAKGAGVNLRAVESQDWNEIPYWCLIPNGVDNMLVAGRCVSATFEGQAAIRIMPVCIEMGQAAGTAAAMCVRHTVKPQELDVKELQKHLKQQGMFIGEH